MPSGDQSQDVFRIAAFSGFTGDNWRALKQQASQAPVLFGDYLAEMVSVSSLATQLTTRAWSGTTSSAPATRR
jgi:hypothetical protein